MTETWNEWWDKAGDVARMGMDAVQDSVNMLGQAFGNVFRGVETDWGQMIRSMLAQWAQQGMMSLLNKLLFGAAGGLAAGGPIGGIIGGIIGGFGSSVGGGAPAVQFITSDPSASMRFGRNVYSADNRVVSGLTGRNLGRTVYQRG